MGMSNRNLDVLSFYVLKKLALVWIWKGNTGMYRNFSICKSIPMVLCVDSFNSRINFWHEFMHSACNKSKYTYAYIQKAELWLEISFAFASIMDMLRTSFTVWIRPYLQLNVCWIVRIHNLQQNDIKCFRFFMAIHLQLHSFATKR